jgi:hypothetical protein
MNGQLRNEIRACAKSGAYLQAYFSKLSLLFVLLKSVLGTEQAFKI